MPSWKRFSHGGRYKQTASYRTGEACRHGVRNLRISYFREVQRHFGFKFCPVPPGVPENIWEAGIEVSGPRSSGKVDAMNEDLSDKKGPACLSSHFRCLNSSSVKRPEIYGAEV